MMYTIDIPSRTVEILEELATRVNLPVEQMITDAIRVHIDRMQSNSEFVVINNIRYPIPDRVP